MTKAGLLGALAAALLLLGPWPAATAEEGIGFGRAVPTLRQEVVLSGVIATTREVIRLNQKPVCVFDLDATLFECGCRHKAIFLEFARENRSRYPRMESLVLAWVPDELPYAVQDMIRRVGATDALEFSRINAFWKKRFFSDEYLRYDHPIAGAVDFVKALSRAGAEIVYLTGRVESKMQKGTIATLLAAGFPLGPNRGVLLMASESGVKDDVFKGSPEVRKRIDNLGTTIAVFDNEPGNCNAMQRSFPAALIVLLDTNHSPGAPGPDPGIPVIGNFRRSVPVEARIADP